MASLIIGVPGLIALIVCVWYGPHRAFLWVYLPALLLLPDDYRWSFVGHFAFAETAIIPIAIFFFLKFTPKPRFSFTDLLVLSYCALIVVAEFLNKDFYEARNVALRAVTCILLPYLLAKGLFNQDTFGLRVAKTAAILLTAVSILSVYEFKMTVDLFESVIRLFFPAPNSVETIRYGLTRIAGPFGHALTAGLILLAGYRIVCWLAWSGYWDRELPLFKINIAQFCRLSIGLGAVMTLARGAWLGATIASLVIVIGRSRDRARALVAVIALIVLVGLPAYWGIRSYLSPSSGDATSLSEQTATYRLSLLTEYLPIIEERPTWGYGRNAFVVEDGMQSIDDHYILISLTSGVYACALFAAILIWMVIRLLRFGFQRAPDDIRGLLAITLAGICTLFMVALMTVYLGGQSGPLLYLFLGWGEGLLVSRAVAIAASAERVIAKPRPRFRRVMAGTIVPVARACG